MKPVETKLPSALNPVVTEEKFTHKGWTFSFSKSIIMKSIELDKLANKLHLQNIPDIVFDKNICQLRNPTFNFLFEINAFDSLQLCNFESRKLALCEKPEKSPNINQINTLPTEIQVKHAELWKNKKPLENTEIKVLQKISDCFYSSPYKGTVSRLDASSPFEAYCEPTPDDIPISNLKENNPIIWANMIPLWEDELGDNGVSNCEFRFRVMNDCFFGLLRHYLRVDDVTIRIYDTRIYHEFDKEFILREFTVREDSYEGIRAQGFKFGPQWMTDHGQSFSVSEFVKVREVFKERIFLK